MIPNKTEHNNKLSTRSSRIRIVIIIIIIIVVVIVVVAVVDMAKR